MNATVASVATAFALSFGGTLSPTAKDFLVVSAGITVILLIDAAYHQRGPVHVESALSAAALVLHGVMFAVATAACGILLAALLLGHGDIAVGRTTSRIASRALSVALAATVLGAIRASASMGELPDVALAIVAAVVIVAAEIGFMRFAMRMPAFAYTAVVSELRSQGLMCLALASVGALIVTLSPPLGTWAWGIAAMLLVPMSQAIAQLSQTRDAYRETVEALVDAAESVSPGRAGHAERVSAIAVDIGATLGFSGSQLESLMLAASLHDVDLIGGESSGAVASGVMFLRGAAPILSLYDGDTAAVASASEVELASVFIIALASAIDAVERGILDESRLPTVAELVSSQLKGRVAGAALSRGYSLPAVAG